MTETLRLFVAIELPPAIQQRVAALQVALSAELESQLDPTSGRARWVAPSDLHLTLRFLGACPTGSLKALESALDLAAAAVPPFELELSGVGSFGERVLWLGVGGETARLHTLHGALEDALEPLAAREPRAFKPHLTLARLSGHAPLPLPAPHWPPATLRVTQLVLVRSELGASPRYTALYRAPLAARGAA